ncbi:MAG: hypothetical protein EXQ55_09315 [Acidobacteria bacterium]|nr:hypothetical protein [Acidobacteriota bacterium]
MPLIIDAIHVYVNCRPGDIREAFASASADCAIKAEWRASAYEGPDIPAGMTEITLRGPSAAPVAPWREESAGVYRQLIACGAIEWPVDLTRSVRALIGRA